MLYTQLIRPMGGEDFDEHTEYPLAIYWALKLATLPEMKFQSSTAELAACVRKITGVTVDE